jgi:hypothetical protein
MCLCIGLGWKGIPTSFLTSNNYQKFFWLNLLYFSILELENMGFIVVGQFWPL